MALEGHGARSGNVRVVRSLSAELLCTVTIEADWDIADLKFEVARASGIPAKEQRMVVQGRVLHFSETLASLFPRFSVASPAEVTLIRLDPKFAKVVDDVRGARLRLEDVDEDYRWDRDVAVAAVQCDGTALAKVSDALRDDRDLVVMALKSHGRALEHASTALKADKELVLKAVTRDGLSIQHANKKLLHDMDVVIAAMEQNAFALELLPSEIKDRREIAELAVTREGQAIQFLSEGQKNDRELILLAVRSNSEALRYISPKYAQDAEIVRAARHGVRIRGVTSGTVYFNKLLSEAGSGLLKSKKIV